MPLMAILLLSVMSKKEELSAVNFRTRYTGSPPVHIGVIQLHHRITPDLGFSTMALARSLSQDTKKLTSPVYQHFAAPLTEEDNATE